MSLIRICESDNFFVDYDTGRGMYRVSAFDPDADCIDKEYWFDAYEEKECLICCKDCKHRDLAGVPPFMYYYCTCGNGLSGSVKDDDFCPYGELRTDE